MLWLAWNTSWFVDGNISGDGVRYLFLLLSDKMVECGICMCWSNWEIFCSQKLSLFNLRKVCYSLDILRCLFILLFCSNLLWSLVFDKFILCLTVAFRFFRAGLHVIVLKKVVITVDYGELIGVRREIARFMPLWGYLKNSC